VLTTKQLRVQTPSDGGDGFGCHHFVIHVNEKKTVGEGKKLK
jgi:hypothetical protein